jgi:hypothetical protein
MMKCPNHPEKEVKSACVGCGNFFCEDCLTQIHQKNYCKNCIVELAESKDLDKKTAVQPQIIIQQNQQQQQQQQQNSSSTAAAVCCIVLIILLIIGWAISLNK